jgi:hypothetical protein
MAIGVFDPRQNANHQRYYVFSLNRLATLSVWIMPTELEGPSERKRKAAQAQAQTNKMILAFAIVIFALILFLIFY